MYVCRLANERSDSDGGVGDRESRETSESDASEEGTGLSGELGSLLTATCMFSKSMVKEGGVVNLVV